MYICSFNGQSETINLFSKFHSVSSATQGNIGHGQKEVFGNKITTWRVLQQFIDKVNCFVDTSSRRWWQFMEQLLSMEHLGHSVTPVLRKVLQGTPREGISIILTSINISCQLWRSWATNLRNRICNICHSKGWNDLSCWVPHHAGVWKIFSVHTVKAHHGHQSLLPSQGQHSSEKDNLGELNSNMVMKSWKKDDQKWLCIGDRQTPTTVLCHR